ncbi:unnamed protein product [Linum trigynum]|uniref:Uncharacterized protein n=1 Tax=Linum trigynum TaxID=586398 RepID=A0AAV2CSJ5_9ROSI
MGEGMKLEDNIGRDKEVISFASADPPAPTQITARAIERITATKDVNEKLSYKTPTSPRWRVCTTKCPEVDHPIATILPPTVLNISKDEVIDYN